MTTLRCWLRRQDGEFYDLGEKPAWGTAIGVFPGAADGTAWFTMDDVPLLALRLGRDRDIPTAECVRIAADIVRWAAGRGVRYVTELDPEVPADGPPSPITGGVA